VQQSAISNQQSAISNQQSAISNQQSAISNQQSAIGNQRSAFSRTRHRGRGRRYRIVPWSVTSAVADCHDCRATGRPAPNHIRMEANELRGMGAGMGELVRAVR